jgi:hypothetical protein
MTRLLNLDPKIKIDLEANLNRLIQRRPLPGVQPWVGNIPVQKGAAPEPPSDWLMDPDGGYDVDVGEILTELVPNQDMGSAVGSQGSGKGWMDGIGAAWKAAWGSPSK